MTRRALAFALLGLAVAIALGHYAVARQCATAAVPAGADPEPMVCGPERSGLSLVAASASAVALLLAAVQRPRAAIAVGAGVVAVALLVLLDGARSSAVAALAAGVLVAAGSASLGRVPKAPRAG